MILIPIILLLLVFSATDSQTQTQYPPVVHPNQSRLLFAPTGRTLPSGTGYIADHFLFFPSAAVGVNDHLTLGGGFSIIPEVALNEQLFYFTPKLNVVSSQDLNLAVGAFIGGFPGTDEVEGTGGILYGVGTLGPPESSLTIGTGFGFAEGNVSGKPVFMVGGEHRMSEGASLVSENWFMSGEKPLLSMGIRLFGERFSVDLAGVGVPGEVWFPWFDVVYSFGH